MTEYQFESPSLQAQLSPETYCLMRILSDPSASRDWSTAASLVILMAWRGGVKSETGFLNNVKRGLKDETLTFDTPVLLHGPTIAARTRQEQAERGAEGGARAARGTKVGDKMLGEIRTPAPQGCGRTSTPATDDGKGPAAHGRMRTPSVKMHEGGGGSAANGVGAKVPMGEGLKGGISGAAPTKCVPPTSAQKPEGKSEAATLFEKSPTKKMHGRGGAAGSGPATPPTEQTIAGVAQTADGVRPPLADLSNLVDKESTPVGAPTPKCKLKINIVHNERQQSSLSSVLVAVKPCVTPAGPARYQISH
jgi:hypothetical protein